ncbi:transporter substrate-binding domain-containing protein [Actinokineospora auranticolor]|uniref:Polar amino acid transport system substrate-binding protein n=1 Tax=Actinokineospora auranticolor TaxID=155976 RepID=A0A2S6GMM8_9PSEU|nr:transporter substrate-binding domain-containing protein [Actinokineospora auranticolor]PPK66391.1 polar amino acid transport system substrate-binding protein [Actinokineospora auranticolor]
MTAARRLAALLCALAASACAVAPRAALPRPTAPEPQMPTLTSAAPAPAPEPCRGTTKTIRPTGTELTGIPSGTTVAEIRARGLRVGVSQTAGRLSSRNLQTGEVSGLEADIAFEIARAIWPDRDPGQVRAQIQYIAMPTRDRFIALDTDENHRAPSATTVATVDMIVADASVTCQRVDTYGARFSVPYLETRQGLLTWRGTDGVWDPRQGVAGKRVCSGAGTINIDRITQRGGIAVPAVDTTDCLVQLQRHQVEAVSTDDVILEGFHDQDPNTEIFPGFVDDVDVAAVAVARQDEDLLRVVNAVLERMRRGEMDALYRKWFGQATTRRMPPADYEGG